jgi:inner membrane transporter RhtA
MPAAVLFVVIAAVSQELGAAFAVRLFSAVGPLGAVFARLAVSAAVLCAVMRPGLSGLPRRSWLSAGGLAAALAVMNTCFYFAIDHIPLGAAVTIEVLGPLVLSVAIGSRRTAWLWALLALAGVAALGMTQPRETMDPVGVAFAAAAAAAWAAYILATRRAGAEFPRLDGLAIATALGALALCPFAVASVDAAAAADWRVIGLGVLVGLLSSVVPYSLELLSLRRLPAETFAVLAAISPVTAAAAGWMVLGQQLGAAGYLAIVLVSLACVGAIRSAGVRAAAIG